MTACIALIRGINVGRARRIAMGDLRLLVEGLGFSNVRTLLNSGNIVFQANRPSASKVAAVIEAAIAVKFGFSARVIVITARELDDIVGENPLLRTAHDPSRHMVAFVATVAKVSTLSEARTLLAKDWAPDALAVGRRAVYLWCAHGTIESRLMREFARLTGDAVTTRNWATVLKLQTAAGTEHHAA